MDGMATTLRVKPHIAEVPWLQTVKLLWAAPCSAVGLAFAAFILMGGGRAKWSRGACEVTYRQADASCGALARSQAAYSRHCVRPRDPGCYRRRTPDHRGPRAGPRPAVRTLGPAVFRRLCSVKPLAAAPCTQSLLGQPFRDPGTRNRRRPSWLTVELIAYGEPFSTDVRCDRRDDTSFGQIGRAHV